MTYKVILFTIMIFIVLIISIKIWITPEINVNVIDYSIKNDVKRYFNQIDDKNKYIVEIIFEIENKNEKEIKTCFIKPNNEIMKYIVGYKDFNNIYPHRFKPGEIRKESIFILFSKNSLNKNEVIHLIENQSFYAYSSYKFWGEEMTDKVKNSKFPFFYRILLSLGKNEVAYLHDILNDR